jgi:hypothetical protein
MAATSTRTTMRSRRRRAATAAASGRLMLARVVRVIAGVVLVLLKANRSNEVVTFFRDAASTLAGPFDGMFTLSPKRVETAVNWGIAAVVWYLVGHLVARLIGR